MIIAGTGSRPQKLGGYDLPNPTYLYIVKELHRLFDQYKPDQVISGGALGFDQYLAAVAIRREIPLAIYVPFIGQEKMWPAKSQQAYNLLIKKASEVKIICEGEYAAWKMQVRNEAMTNDCNLLISCWDGSSGGTKNCIDYATKIGRERINIDPRKALENEKYKD